MEHDSSRAPLRRDFRSERTTQARMVGPKSKGLFTEVGHSPGDAERGRDRRHPTWPETFEQERTSLLTALMSPCTDYRAYWSTAVPGLDAKPIIDIQLSVRALAEARSSCVGPVQALGYAYMPQYEARLPGELFFRKGLFGPWTHHLHILQGDHPRWRRRLLFRDYLRNHPKVVHAYAKLKRDLAAAFDDDISGYMNAKTAFVAATLAEALGPGEQVVLDRPLPP